MQEEKFSFSVDSRGTHSGNILNVLLLSRIKVFALLMTLSVSLSRTYSE
jgi:hypothetical protein